MNIYVANIPWKANVKDLQDLFEKHGQVSSARIIKDRETKRSRGFGFVEMPDDEAANDAIANLNGYVMMEKALVVSEAKAKE
jgi:RNA recognition motif-containing protein